jgi:hypothetical protein
MRAWIVATVVVACGSPPRAPVATPMPTPPAPVSTPIAAPPPPATPPAPASPLASAPTIAVTTPVACAFDTPNVKTPIPLFTRSSKYEFAEAVSGPLRLVILHTGDEIAEITRPGLVLHAITHISLHAAGPLVLGGVLSVAPDAKLHWSGGSAGMLTPIAPVKIFEPDKPLDAHPCKDFAIEVAKYDPKQVVPKASAKFAPRTRLITDKHPVKLATSATDPPLGDLAASYSTSRVTELAQQAGRSFFTLTLKDGVLFGWVATADLEPDDKTFGIGYGTGVPLIKPTQKLSTSKIFDVVCSHDMRVIADESGNGAVPYTFIGTIRAGTKFTYRSEGDLVVPLLGVAGIARAWGSLAVEADAMKDCLRTRTD